MSTPYLGEIRVVGFNFPPEGWATCNGQTLSIVENQALFSLLGTTYGGDGQSTFGVPDMRSRVGVGSEGGAAGPGLTAYQLGATGGAENVTLTTPQLPVHGHPYAVPLMGTTAGTAGLNPVGNLPAATGSALTYASAQSGGNLAGGAVANGVAGPSPAGGGQSHPNVKPVLALNYIICTEGLYPPRPQ